jgi:uncharacterized membrane protein YphA (DoxX/SURF4 family)
MTNRIVPGRALNWGLWAAQVVLAIAFGFFGFLKATQPLDSLSHMMSFVNVFPPLFVRTLGVLEMLGAIGIVLPWLTRILPWLTVLTALCFVVLQALAIAYHAAHGETAQTIGLNLVLIALSGFVLWGRR